MVFLTIPLIILGAILPALIWLLFFLKEDVRPEPTRLIIYTFAAGALVSIPVLSSQVAFQGIINQTFKSTAALIIGLALIEEIFKFLAAYFSVNRRAEFDEPIDAMIYMIAAALGFASIENIFITANMLEIIDAHSVTNVLNTLILRFIGATFLHIIASGLVGYHWAKGRIQHTFLKSLTYGIVLATAVHAVFNYLILQFQYSTLLYPSLFLIILAFFVLNDFEKLKT